MPLYEYVCTKCKHRFEKIQKFSDPKIKKCPECGGKVEQVLHAPAVQFKGTGWYVTDYAQKGTVKEAVSPDKGASDKKDTKDEAKPAKEASESKSKKSESKKPKD